MSAGLIMIFGLLFTVALLVPVVVVIALAVNFENGRYDRRRHEPRPVTWNPEFHSQLKGMHQA